MKTVKMCMGLALAILVSSCGKETGIENFQEGDSNPQFLGTNYDWSMSNNWHVFEDAGLKRFRINIVGNSTCSGASSTVNSEVKVEFESGLETIPGQIIWTPDLTYTAETLYVAGRWNISYGLADPTDPTNCEIFDHNNNTNPPIVLDYRYADILYNQGNMTFPTQPNGAIAAPNGGTFCDGIYYYRHLWNVSIVDNDGDTHDCATNYIYGTTQKSCN